MAFSVNMRVCVKCQRFLKIKKTGVWVLEWAAVRPYRIWRADIWECPECGFELITGFGDGPIAHASMKEKFEPLMEKICESGNFIEAYHGPYSKAEGEEK